MNRILKVTDENVDNIVKGNEKVIVKFTSDWCNMCKVLSPIFEKVAKQNSGSTVFCECDVEQAPKWTDELCIMTLPTVIVFEDGSPMESFSGFLSEDDLKEILIG